MKCNGKCHLKKTIEKAETEERKDKSAPTVIKLTISQDIPSQKLQFEFNQTMPPKNMNDQPSQAYSSPVLDIVSPPPQVI
jgi:hypothetical protein